MLELRLELQHGRPNVAVEEEQSRPEVDFGKAELGEQRAARVDVEERAAQQAARFLPAVEPAPHGDKRHLVIPFAAVRSRQPVEQCFAVVALGTLGRDEKVPWSLEFVVERLMPNDIDLLGSDQPPIGAVALGDRRRGERNLRHACRRKSKVGHGSSLVRLPYRSTPRSTLAQGSRRRSDVLSLTFTARLWPIPPRDINVPQDRDKSAKPRKPPRRHSTTLHIISNGNCPRWRAGNHGEIPLRIVSDLRQGDSTLVAHAAATVAHPAATEDAQCK